MTSEIKKRRDELAREYCKDWPSEVYHPGDLAGFFEHGFDAAYSLAEAERDVRENGWLKKLGELQAQLAERDDAIRALAEALDFYSHTDHYEETFLLGQALPRPPGVLVESGDKARQALTAHAETIKKARGEK